MEEINLNEEIVFDEVVNEVSIVDDEQNRNQNLIVQTSSPSIDNNLNQFIQTSIKSPVNNTGQVTSIKNVTPNFKNKQSSLTSNNQSKLVNNIVITPKTSPQVKKASSNTKNVTIQNKPTTPTTINISPSSGISLQNNQILTKVIMTTGGQQLLITSPIKGHTRTENSNNLSNQTPERQLMAILPVSPNKQQSKLNTSTSSSTNVSIRPKPANITISSPSLNQSSDSKPQYQIIRLVTATTNGNGNSTVNTISTSGLKQIGQNIPGQQHKVLIPASALKNLNASQLLSTSGSTSQLVMYAPTVVQPSSISTPTTPKTVTFSTANVQPIAGGISSSNLQQRHSYVPILPNPSTVISNSASKTINQAVNQKSIQNGSKNGEESIQIASTSTINSGPSSNRPRKPCNCTRSQCLKLYCDCFANGEFCSNCNCINCSNNLDHEENRQKAIKQCLERNPHAFHPKIGKGKTTAQEGIERRHTKGCNCRRSGCLKNYCECYEAKILCTDLCKCCACKNYEDSYERKSLMHLVDAVDIRSSLHGTSGSNFIGKENDPLWGNEFRPKLPVPLIPEKLLSCSFVTNELVDATCQCLIAQAEKSQKLGLNPDEVEKSIIEEFGNCLVQIIDVAKKEKQKEK